MINNNLGIIYKNIKQYDKALECYANALKIFEKSENKDNIASCLINMGVVEFFKNDYDKSIEYTQNGLGIAKEADAKLRIHQAYENLAEIYQAKGDYQKAFEYLNLFIEIHDEIFNEQKSKQIAEIHTKYETEKKEQEITFLKKELDLKEKQLQEIAHNMIQRNKLINTLEEKLEIVDKTSRSPRVLITNIITDLKKNVCKYQNWDDFENRFNEIYPYFLIRLEEKYPNLTHQELKICALTKINLTTQKISDILCLSTATIKSYRYRARKKIDLPSNITLKAFLEEF
jgi:tetratricopeptide (TPR) repeat protein